jgi:hypothetical protein
MLSGVLVFLVMKKRRCCIVAGVVVVAVGWGVVVETGGSFLLIPAVLDPVFGVCCFLVVPEAAAAAYVGVPFLEELSEFRVVLLGEVVVSFFLMCSDVLLSLLILFA